MTKLDLIWMNWSHINKNTGEFVLNEDAPKEAKESYFKYIKQIEDIDRRTTRTFVVPKTIEGIKWCEENGWYNICDHSHETEYYVLYDIPYDEFCVLREIDDIDDLIDEYEAKRLPISRIEEYIKMINKSAPELTNIVEFLSLVLEYKTYVDFSEEHII